MKATFKRTIIYQVGVDILGFPMYVQHDIYQDNPVRTMRGGNSKSLKWLTVVVKLFKQH